MSNFLLSTDTKVFVSGADIDGIPRGKVLKAEKFNHSNEGFGFCNVIFAWDMHDNTYDPKTPSMLQNAGFSDILAKIDLTSARRCPLTNTPHFLLDFYNPVTQLPLPYCPRSLLRRIISTNANYKPLTGVEFEFFNFKVGFI
jgi:glutamine synthetase